MKTVEGVVGNWDVGVGNGECWDWVWMWLGNRSRPSRVESWRLLGIDHSSMSNVLEFARAYSRVQSKGWWASPASREISLLNVTLPGWRICLLEREFIWSHWVSFSSWYMKVEVIFRYHHLSRKPRALRWCDISQALKYLGLLLWWVLRAWCRPP